LAHRFGSRAYDDESTARDNWAVALLTFGEGYHSFHHRFPADFRNGIRWYSWDPSKWFIGVLKLTHLASRLRSTAASTIEQTRMEVAVKGLETRIASAGQTRAAEIQLRIMKARDAFKSAMALWRTQTEARAKGQIAQYKEAYCLYCKRLNEAREEWRGVLRALKHIPQPT
jgi:stearoyl-CoA desaturase (delta-9 desaturase)